MNWEAIGAVGEIVSALAVLITLAYLSVQIKQNSRTQKAQTHQQLAHDRGQNLRSFLDNKELRDAVRKASSGQSVTEDERAILYWFTTIAVRNYENELYQHSQGMIDDSELEIQRGLLNLPHMQIEAVVALSGHVYTPEVQQELRSLIEKRKARRMADTDSA